MLATGLLMTLCPNLAAQHSHAGATPLEFPDIPGYQTIITDLHQHTVFSDGSVWPDIRVMEALREGMDAISLTEHLEYQPHAADIPHPDRNRSYEIALREAAEHELMIIRGSEITRHAPIGHSNAVFITNANELLSEQAEVSFAQAKNRGLSFSGTTRPGMPSNPRATPCSAISRKPVSLPGSCTALR